MSIVRHSTLSAVTLLALTTVSMSAFAQNAPAISQYGVGTVARYGQVGTSNSLTIYQDQSSGGVDSRQAYTDSLTGETTTSNLYARINQTGLNGAAANANSGTVIQAGNKQVGKIHQAGSENYAFINQANNSNRSNTTNVEQYQNKNTARITQSSAENSSTNVGQNGTQNVLDVEQYGKQLSTNNIQIGTNNRIRSYQTGTNQASKISQNGSDNNVDIIQTNLNNGAAINQSGSKQTAVVRQYSTSNRTQPADTLDTTADIKITQTGANGQATVYQDARTVNNKASVSQNGGVVGIITGSITGPIVLDASQPNSAVLEQTVDAKNNTGTIAQDGAGLRAEMQQQGNGSTASIFQNLARNNQNQPTTKSYRNKAGIFQGATSGGSNASILQQGGFNGYDAASPTGMPKTYIHQFAANNTGFITQKGDYNNAGISQSTVGNTANITQTKNFNEATVYQSGPGTNNVSLTQASNQDSNTTSVLANRALLQQMGTGNKLNATAEGAATKTDVSQFGNTNTATVGIRNNTGGGDLQTTLHQIGDGNTAYTSTLDVNLTSNYVTQNGNTNTVNSTLFGGGNGSYNGVYQTGNGNKNTVYNNSVGGLQAVSTQFGNNNTTAIESDTSHYRVRNSRVDVAQVGDKNTANVHSTLKDSNVRITQKGNGNKADITSAYHAGDNVQLIGQFEGIGGINQEGIENTAGIVLAANSLNNKANIIQKGNFNSAFQDINGSSNTLYISQNGDNNKASQKILGSSNELSIIQQGSNNTGNIDWIGNNNQLSITQTGNGHSYSLSGNNNAQVIAITQSN